MSFFPFFLIFLALSFSETIGKWLSLTSPPTLLWADSTFKLLCKNACSPCSPFTLVLKHTSLLPLFPPHYQLNFLHPPNTVSTHVYLELKGKSRTNGIRKRCGVHMSQLAVNKNPFKSTLGSSGRLFFFGLFHSGGRVLIAMVMYISLTHFPTDGFVKVIKHDFKTLASLFSSSRCAWLKFKFNNNS